MNVPPAAVPGQLFGDVQFSTVSSPVVPIAGYHSHESAVSFGSFQKHIPGFVRFVRQMGEHYFPLAQIETRWGTGFISMGPQCMSLNVMEVKDHHNDYFTCRIACEKEVANAALTYGARRQVFSPDASAFTVRQRANIGFKEENNWVSIGSHGVSSLIVTAGAALLEQILSKHGIPPPRTRADVEIALAKLAAESGCNMVPVANMHPMFASSEVVSAPHTSAGIVRSLVLNYNPHVRALHLENNIAIRPDGTGSIYAPVVVDVVKAAAAMRPQTFPLSSGGEL